jgi:hypothetical protein
MTRTVQELRIRRTVCDGIIRELIKIGDSDPRQHDALICYKAQLKELDAELTEAERAERQRLGIPEPEPINIGLKPAILFGKADKE